MAKKYDIDFLNNTVTLTASFLRKASVIGSAEYQEMLQLRRELPDYEFRKAEAPKQTENGTLEEASGKDISSWVSLDDRSKVSFTLTDIAAYRTAGASKAMSGFDVINYRNTNRRVGM